MLEPLKICKSCRKPIEVTFIEQLLSMQCLPKTTFARKWELQGKIASVIDYGTGKSQQCRPSPACMSLSKIYTNLVSRKPSNKANTYNLLFHKSRDRTSQNPGDFLVYGKHKLDVSEIKVYWMQRKIGFAPRAKCHVLNSNF